MKFHLYRIADNAFFIYSLDTTERSKSHIQLVECGKAWSPSGGHYSDNFKKKAAKYDIDLNTMRGSWITAETYSDFVCRIYLKTYSTKTLEGYGNISGPLFSYISSHYHNSKMHLKGVGIAKILKAFDDCMETEKIKEIVMEILI